MPSSTEAIGATRPRGRARSGGVRVRPLADLECLIAFSPSTRTLHWLNLTAWALFELCDGTRSDDEVAAAFGEAMAGALSGDDLAAQVGAGLDSLEQNGLITQSPGHDRAS